MKPFYAQLHLHTSETSKCGRSTGREMALACKKAGYDLIAVTDHFFNANIGCDKNLPWEAKVEYLFRGYYAAKKAGDEIGLEVIRGWETFHAGPELLTYGLDENFLLAHPDIDKVPYLEYIKLVKDAGGKIIHAHPYRRRSYIPLFTPDTENIEAFEVYNPQNKSDESDNLAYEDALKNKLLMFAGCDAHHTDDLSCAAMKFANPVHTIHEIFGAARAGESEIIRVL